jgi:hypothetical protein
MAIRVVAAAGPSFGEPGGLTASAERGIARSLESRGARLLRVWDTPAELDADQGLLVVADAPDSQELVDLLIKEGLRVIKDLSVVPLDPGEDRPADLDAIGRRLAADFPDVLVEQVQIGDYAPGEIVGFAMCPDCGGWGSHSGACPRA